MVLKKISFIYATRELATWLNDSVISGTWKLRKSVENESDFKILHTISAGIRLTP